MLYKTLLNEFQDMDTSYYYNNFSYVLRLMLLTTNVIHYILHNKYKLRTRAHCGH